MSDLDLKHKYDELIISKFREIGYEPRDKQITLINKVLVRFIDADTRYVVMSASTGIGKSLIGLVTNLCLEELLNTKSNAYILAHTNTLLDQYDEYNEKNDLNFITLKGASNYDCSVYYSNAERCTKDNNQVHNCVPKAIREDKCSTCRYNYVTSNAKKHKFFCTNYAYFLTSGKLEPRTLTVYDEAHLVSDLIVDHVALEINNEITQELLKISKDEKMPSEIQTEMRELDGLLFERKVSEENFIDYAKRFQKVLTAMFEYINARMQAAISIKDTKGYSHLKNQMRVVTRSLNKCEILNMEIEKVIDIQYMFVRMTPIFAKELFSNYIKSDYHLFMSATLDKEYLCDTLGLDRDEVAFIKSGAVFPAENKKVYLCNAGFMNYTKMNDDKFVSNMCDDINFIVEKHCEKENGIILAPSFKLCKQIYERLSDCNLDKNLGVQIYLHDGNAKLGKILEKFKKHQNESKARAILISPSLFEGISLDDDICRYQIFVKAPYPSLQDKRMEFISKNYGHIYRLITLYKIIQGAGRSCRSDTDYCVNYFLDNNIKSLFLSSQNKWLSEFDVHDIGH